MLERIQGKIDGVSQYLTQIVIQPFNLATINETRIVIVRQRDLEIFCNNLNRLMTEELPETDPRTAKMILHSFEMVVYR